MSADGGAVAAAGVLPEALRAEIEEKMKENEANFNSSELGDAGAVFVAEKLRGNTIVEELLLIECGVGPRGALALGEALKENTTLKALRLAYNGIGEDGTECLAHALRGNESLEYLNLFQCQLTDVGALSILSALRESNSTLKNLALHGNDGIKDSTIMDSILELIEENRDVDHTSAEQRARCLLFCCLQLAPCAHEHVVPSVGAVPVPVMQYAVEHAGELHVAERFEVSRNVVVGQSSAGVRGRSAPIAVGELRDLQPASARRR